MRAGHTSLLRRITHASSRAVLLGSATLALAAPAAAAAPAPDPSPLGAGAARPDPYHAPQAQAPAQVSRPRPVVVTRPAPIVIAPVAVAPRAHVPTVVKHRKVRVHHAKPKPKAQHGKRAIPLTAAATFAPAVRRIPPFISQVASQVRDRSPVSASLALVVAGLVLLSGMLLVGAAREVAR
jgi:hypothetical protein